MIRIICTGDDASCDHLHQNGAKDTLVRLPETVRFLSKSISIKLMFALVSAEKAPLLGSLTWSCPMIKQSPRLLHISSLNAREVRPK